MTTGLVFDREYLLHEQTPFHPERRERLAYTIDQFTEEGLFCHPAIRVITPLPATRENVERVHRPEYISFLEGASEKGGFIDFDTIIPRGLFRSALLAAGGAIRAGASVWNGECRNAFALVRPPGHHARASSGAGFCYLNNMAIMIRHLQRAGAGRILVLDWDAHHGDGTQSIFYDDPSVLFTSIHQRPLYPGSGGIEELGEGPGLGYTVNMPVPPGTGDESYHYLFDTVIAPLAEEFSPDLIAISAGQDVHFTDPLAGLAVTARGYAELVRKTVDLAERICYGRVVAILEGGYSVEGGLPYTNLGIVAALAGLSLENIREPAVYDDLFLRAFDPSAQQRVRMTAEKLCTLLSPHWACFS